MKATVKRLLIGLAIAVGVFAATLGVRQRIVSRSDAAESSTIIEAPPASQPVVPLEKIRHATIVEIPGIAVASVCL